MKDMQLIKKAFQAFQSTYQAYNGMPKGLTVKEQVKLDVAMEKSRRELWKTLSEAGYLDYVALAGLAAKGKSFTEFQRALSKARQ